jgi:hypothetical protein
MLDLVERCDKVERGRLRVLLISQETPEIRRGLSRTWGDKPSSRILCVSETDTRGDIEIYVKKRVGRIAEKYAPFSDDVAECLRNMTVAKSKGQC